ncbi:indole-3-glycerol phosphate synthase TrpC [Loigolactobacillus bifermentans]|uniref:indole-3-glycerol phosphate synthase TrpC n=1 Tax=Loigolactobacillus bifermentans TaxID=1607 RepID=UPI00070DD442|nr:indole-3-glycerol phosphate synthase TrpC [Loigolactobacillus bifermentans]QGG61063.1 indole-3-glycerol phosphate synthase TrpC [Loigolactobacillus bifermentans]
MILDQLVAATAKRLVAEKAALPLATLKQQVAALPVTQDFPFEANLRQPGLHVIAEVKKASPSKGLIAPDFPYLQIAKDYAVAGVSGISVLTEPDYFQGQLAYLSTIAANVNVPVLRKDFTIDPYMIYQAKAAGASVILLIVAILTPHQLRDYLNLAHSLGLSAIVEAHDAAEVAAAQAAGARIIGVNNRNLKDFTVDFHNSLTLRQQIPAETLMIAESGIQTPADIAQLAAAKINGVLIGETLMRAPDKAAKLAELFSEVPAHDAN